HNHPSGDTTPCDLDIQLMLRNVDITTLAISLAGANEDIKNKIFKNLSRNAYEMIVQRVKNIEENDAKNILIEMNRAKLLKVMD
ncbi:MAG TPA: FliG C-terminal domain-containing protein, partial [Exilispira sp.]|nr:FliG C-terminal domain-containing protein [Exilispira sp.]